LLLSFWGTVKQDDEFSLFNSKLFKLLLMPAVVEKFELDNVFSAKLNADALILELAIVFPAKLDVASDKFELETIFSTKFDSACGKFELEIEFSTKAWLFLFNGLIGLKKIN